MKFFYANEKGQRQGLVKRKVLNSLIDPQYDENTKKLHHEELKLIKKGIKPIK